jgi:cytochrome P450
MSACSQPARDLRGHWLLGCLREIFKDPLGLYTRAWREHGDYVRLRIAPLAYAYLLSHPHAVEHVLQKNARNYRKPELLTKPMRPLIGNGLFVSEGEFWLRQRRLMQPAFHRQQLARLAPLMVFATEAFVERRLATGLDQAVDIVEEMARLSLQIASTTLFGSDLTAGDPGSSGSFPEVDSIYHAYRTGFQHVTRPMKSFQLSPGWLPTRANRAFARAKKVLDRVVLKLIEARRQTASPPADLLSLLLAARDEETGGRMTDQQVRDEVVTLLTAGHETMVAALSWAWYLLGQHPRVQDGLADEVRGRFGGGDTSLTAEDLPHLPLARAVFEETLRLYPPAWGVPRQASAADEIGGLPIPAKGVVILSQWITHRHPDFWPRPEQFQPERFLPGQETNRHRFAYFPFGGGPRGCIGNTFALMEGTLVLAAIARRFRVELLPGQAVVPDPGFTLRPRTGITAVLRLR